MTELRILSPTAILGYGFPLTSFQAGLERDPHVIAVDAGSTDPGPYYLGAGKSFTGRAPVKRDLCYLIEAALERGIPLIVGTAGGSGAKPHVDWTVEIVREVLREIKAKARLAVIYSDVDPELLREELRRGRVQPLGPVAPLTEEEIAASSHIVAQMGLEPIMEALEAGAQIIVAGRAYDPTVFAALPVMQGYDPALALHLGKILECAAIAATPGSGSDCLFGYLRSDSFILEALNPQRKCTKLSVAAHTLYEKSDPYSLPGPGGTLDLRETRFEELPGGKVRVSGTRFIPTEKYFLKLEGARRIGFRTISIAGVRDPIMISQIDEVIAAVKERVADNFRDLRDYQLHVHCYGKNGVMGALEPQPQPGHELGLVMEAVAPTQDVADTICSFFRSTLLHFGYPGRKSTAGNLAFPYSPSDISTGPVYQFSVYHLLEVDDPKGLFAMEVREE
ncbi:MAG TPA: acyclic terpene utilization AtuA family protein [Limnochordia bacterium]|nr:acyclic terpene utilization AtuA family protein [Limnochordia bacterium]